MLGQFESQFKNMFLVDKVNLEWYRKFLVDELISESDHTDPLEFYYCTHFQPYTFSDSENVSAFNSLLSLSHGGAEEKEIICTTTQLSFTSTIPNQRIEKAESIFHRSIIKVLSKATFDPFSLQHITAAQSVRMLKYYKPKILIGIYNATKKQDLYIRVGALMARKNYRFANIVKHHIYKQAFEPLVGLQYFKNLELSPKPFCVKCGLTQKMDEFHCWCLVCDLTRGAIVFTPIAEKPFHTTYF